MMKRIIFLILTIVLLSSAFLFLPACNNENSYIIGNQAQDIVNIANAELEYKEEGDGFTKYGEWFGINPGAWCAMFVSWCADQAGVPVSVVPKHANVQLGMDFFKNQGTWRWGKYWATVYGHSFYTPEAGDLVYFGYNSDIAVHVGLVCSSDETNVYTIEGNINGGCIQASYPLDSDFILGYGHPNYTEKSQLPASGESEMTLKTAGFPYSFCNIDDIVASGVIESNYNITWVRIAVYDTKGNIVLSHFQTTDTACIDIKYISSYIDFSQLDPGTYVYCVEAIDAKGTYEILLMAPFTTTEFFAYHSGFPYKVYGDRQPKVYEVQSENSEIVGTVSGNEKIYVMEILEGFAYFKSDDISGWVSLDDIAPDFEPVDAGKLNPIYDLSWTNGSVSDSAGNMNMNISSTAGTIVNDEKYGNVLYLTSGKSSGDDPYKINGYSGIKDMRTYTVEALIKLTSKDTTHIWNISESNSNCVLVDRYTYFGFGNDGTEDSDLIYERRLPTEEWIHVVSVNTGNAQTIYINGVPVAGATFDIVNNPYLSDTVYLGYQRDRVTDFYVAKFAVYSSAATVTQVEELYNAVK